MRLLHLGIGVVVSVGACSGASQPADGGPAGSSGMGGVGGGGVGGSTSPGGSSGIGGSGGSQSLPPVPACVAALIASCPLTGACTFSRNDAGEDTPYCFALGRTLAIERVIRCSGLSNMQALTVIAVRNADGSVCYTRESRCTCNFACEDASNTWKNARGEVVAEGAANSTRSIMCHDGSESATVNCFGSQASPGCLAWGDLPGGPSTTTSCTEGACALP